MSPRRLLVSTVLLATAGAGAGLAANASATPAPGAIGCVNPGPLCGPYDTAKAETGAALSTAVADCTSTFDSTPCPQLATVGGTVYNDVFFPYAVCYHVNGTTYCIGPIE